MTSRTTRIAATHPEWGPPAEPRRARLLARGAARLLAVGTLALAVGCADPLPQGKDRPLPGPGTGLVVGDETVELDPPCSDGETRGCKVILAHDGPVTTCFVGISTCEGGVWSACAETDDADTGPLAQAPDELAPTSRRAGGTTS